MTNVALVVLAGFGTCMSLIAAIGAQNAFVLRQGIRRDAVLTVVAICGASDAVLIGLGVGGVGVLVQAWPTAVTAVAVVGGLFLLSYGFLAAKRAMKPSSMSVDGATTGSRKRAALTCLAMTWLNPHVYLDTVLLMGSIAAGYGALRWDFAIGAVLASLCWFTAIGFGARLLSSLFTKPSSWRVLDGLVAATMAVVGIGLLVGA
ncbi:LysE/ArgO family amino acid transporter [Kutzneria buriramensis]|uniref:L-lysine exporter family protein LysE/ArgO n=1 Tax=Kutzneria buriramensis TaxID=1045776 RepID=A0A3E0HCG5_9PSEU|nr:LysE family transporter [Kutzneria buriramensis]REH42548.1 L-lysine exporter family protein LysE/ArgO [Kutzneria buriramensis]